MSTSRLKERDRLSIHNETRPKQDQISKWRGEMKVGDNLRAEPTGNRTPVTPKPHLCTIGHRLKKMKLIA